MRMPEPPTMVPASVTLTETNSEEPKSSEVRRMPVPKTEAVTPVTSLTPLIAAAMLIRVVPEENWSSRLPAEPPTSMTNCSPAPVSMAAPPKDMKRPPCWADWVMRALTAWEVPLNLAPRTSKSVTLAATEPTW